MAAITHTLVSAVVDDAVAGEVGPDEWNDDHVISGEDLTKSDDTNVTLTLGGTPTGALLEAVVLTLGWQNQLSIARGGTGAGTALAAFNALSVLTTRGDMLTRDATNNVRIGIGAVGTIWRSDGTDPSWTANLKVSGWGRIGNATDPANTTAGDLTVERLRIPDAAFGGGLHTVRNVELSRTFVPANSFDSVMRIAGTAQHDASTTGSYGIHINLDATPTASGSSGVVGAHVAVGHPSGNFNLAEVIAIIGRLDIGSTGTHTTGIGGHFRALVNGGTPTVTTLKGVYAELSLSVAGTITTGIGVDVLLNRSSGTFTTGIGLRIQAATGTIGTDIAIQSLGGQNRFVGVVNFGTNAAPTTGWQVELSNGGRMLVTGSVTLSTTQDSMFRVSNTITNDALQVNGIRVNATFNGNGNQPIGVDSSVTFVPSGDIASAVSFVARSIPSPTTGITITSVWGMFPSINYGDTAGAVTNGIVILVNAPIIGGALKPTNQYGLQTLNQGAAGITNAVGVYITAVTGATNNYDMGFTTVDTTAAGAYYGRIPVLYNGLKKYIHVFSA